MSHSSNYERFPRLIWCVRKIAQLVTEFHKLDRYSADPVEPKKHLEIGLQIGRLACAIETDFPDDNYLDVLAEVGELNVPELFDVQRCKIVYQFAQRPQEAYEDIGCFDELEVRIAEDELSWDLDSFWHEAGTIACTHIAQCPHWLTDEIADGLYKAIVNSAIETHFATLVDEFVSRRTASQSDCEEWLELVDLDPQLDGSLRVTQDYLSSEGISDADIESWLDSLQVRCDLDLAIQILRGKAHFPSVARTPRRWIRDYPVW